MRLEYPKEKPSVGDRVAALAAVPRILDAGCWGTARLESGLVWVVLLRSNYSTDTVFPNGVVMEMGVGGAALIFSVAPLSPAD